MSIKKWLKSAQKKLRAWTASTNKPIATPSPDPAPSMPVNWKTQQLFAGVNYHWSSLEWGSICARLKSLGYTGVHCELMEMVMTGSLRDAQAAQIRMLKSVADNCRRNGLILMVANNSNDRLNDHGGMTIELMRERLEQLKNFIGTESVLLQPMSENDSRTDVNVRVFARGWAMQNWPAEQIAHYGERVATGFREEHSSVLALSQPSSRMLFITDNTSQRVEQMTATAYVALAAKHIRAGNSFAIYGFHTSPDWTAWEAIAKAFRERDNVVIEPKPAPQDEAIPLEVMSAAGFREGSKLPAIGSMPVTKTLAAARTNGRVVMFEPRSPFGEGAWLCGAWREGDKWFWSDMEGLHFDDTSQNYANNIFPAPSKKLPGRCREKDGTAHYPRKGEPLYVFIANNRLTERTNIVYSGLQS